MKKKIIFLLLAQFVCVSLFSQTPSEFQEMLKKANAGNLDAQYSVGVSYAEGRGVEQNDSEAFKWFMKAAERGDYRAQFCVAMCFDKGMGTAQNDSEAFRWYMKSAEQGTSKAQCAVGDKYFYGKGVAKNYSDALKWYMKAAEQGHTKGQYNVGVCYQNGIGVTQNYSEALRWYIKAAEQGHIDAQYMAGWCYANSSGVNQDWDEAFKWYMKAAEQGDAESQYNVGACYANGNGVTQNFSEAIRWYSLAMQKDCPYAYKDMAYIYIFGDGVERDEKKAFEMVDTAIRLSPKDPEFYDAKGVLYSLVGDREHAMEMWDVIMALDSTYEKKNTRLCRYVRKMKSIDVDNNIPTTHFTNNKTFAVIIANENYSRESNVPYALNDGSVFSNYCTSVLGVPSTNTHFVRNATLNELHREVDWITGAMKKNNGEAKVIFYYAGHGIPDESSKSALLLPVDGYGSDAASGYPLSDLYSALGNAPSQSVLVFLDACFSGTKRDGEMMTSARGVAIKVIAESPVGNMLTFSASQGDETAYPYDDKGHGLFTYYLLKKLQETKGDVTLGELCDYVTTQVRQQSVVINNKPQTPSVMPSSKISDSWQSLTIR